MLLFSGLLLQGLPAAALFRPKSFYERKRASFLATDGSTDDSPTFEAESDSDQLKLTQCNNKPAKSKIKFSTDTAFGVTGSMDNLKVIASQDKLASQGKLAILKPNEAGSIRSHRLKTSRL